ncbi:hypothetical protein J3459_011924 [Metarhizium acridum]|nr:hypothetical protein J3459_011924 [Metarhizium acridum]
MSRMPNEAVLQSLRGELKGNIFRNVDGFYAKYFDPKPWTAVIRNKWVEPKSADILSKLSASVRGVADLDALVE